jgi:hypothetical protein
MRTVKQIETMVNEGRKSDRQFRVTSDSHGHDVRIYSGSRLRCRFRNGASRMFADQSLVLDKWVAGGCKGNCFPRDEARNG